MSYTPSQDSTSGFADLDPTRLVLYIDDDPSEVDRQGCPCGCGQWPKTRGAEFAKGHQAILKAKLVRAHLAKVEVLLLEGAHLGDPYPALDLARLFGWDTILNDARKEWLNKNSALKADCEEDMRLRHLATAPWGGYVGIFEIPDRDHWGIKYLDTQGEVIKTKVPRDQRV